MRSKPHTISFIIAVLATSWVVQYIAFSNMLPPGWMGVYMFVPATVGFIFYQFVDRAPLKQQAMLFTNRVGIKTVLFALCYPLLWMALVVAVAMLTGVASLNDEFIREFAVRPFLLQTLVHTATAVPMMFGEEYGWRGYLLPTAAKRWGRIKATLLVGGVWGLWHIPSYYITYSNADLGNPYIMTLLGMMLVSIGAVAYSYCFFLSKNILPCVLLHIVYDVVAQNLFTVPSIYEGPIRMQWSTSLLLMAGVGSVLAVYLLFRTRELFAAEVD